MLSRMPGTLRVGAAQKSGTAMFPAPTRGWIKNQSLAVAQPGGAEVLENWFPTSQGCRMRKGSVKKATIGTDPVTHLTSYGVSATAKFFATDAANICDITSPTDADTAVSALVTGLTSGDWSSVEFANSAGNFLVMVNGADSAQIYNGTLFGPLDSGVTYSLAYDAQTGDFTKGLTVTGGTSGATGTILFDDDDGTTGTLYLTGVTGTFQDNETITDSSTGSATVNGTATSVYPAITGVSTSDLSHVWKFKSRLFFIESGTMSAWYLGNLAIGGAATELPLGGVFQLGGSLLFGATFSSDTGAGPDDFCLFFTTEGEFAMFQGTDPSSAATWSIVGVYTIGRPLHKNCWFKGGGDVAVGTDDGIVPVSAAIKADRAALFSLSVTYPIEEAWREIIKERGGTITPFSVALWQSETMLVVGVPTTSGLEKMCLVANTKTGAWAKYTGWDTRCVRVFDDKLYFGTASGTILQGETQGADEGSNYSAVFLPRFDSFGKPQEKAALQARVIARANQSFTPQLFANADFEVSIPAPGNADTAVATNTWGSGVWGTSEWGALSDTKMRLSEWQGVSALGQALSAGLIVTSGRSSAPDIELIALHLQYEMGQVF